MRTSTSGAGGGATMVLFLFRAVFFVCHVMVLVDVVVSRRWAATTSLASIVAPALAWMWLRLLLLSTFQHRYLAHRSFRFVAHAHDDDEQQSVVGDTIAALLSSTAFLPHDPLTLAAQHNREHSDNAYVSSSSSTSSFADWLLYWWRQSHIRTSTSNATSPTFHPHHLLVATLWHLFALAALTLVARFAFVDALITLALSHVLLWHASVPLFAHTLVSTLLRGYQLYLPLVDDQDNNAATSHPLYHAYNHAPLSFLTCGGAYLNTHTTFPRAAYHGQSALELDASSWLIRALAACRLVHSVCTIEQLEHEQREQQRKQRPASATTTTTTTTRTHQPHQRIYVGLVSHTRMWPFYHRFQYRAMYVWMELCRNAARTHASLDSFWLWSTRDWSFARRLLAGVPAFVSFHTSDYLARDRLVALIESELPALHDRLHDPSLRVFVLTNPRFFGFTFNPISYYFCYAAAPATRGSNNGEAVAMLDAKLAQHAYDPERGELIAMISEVHNTPWGEKCHYVHPVRAPPVDLYPVLDGVDSSAADSSVDCGGSGGGNCDDDGIAAKPVTSAASAHYLPFFDHKHKKMHVSPFMAMNYIYLLRYSLPRSTWDVRWQMHHTDRNVFVNASTSPAAPTYCLGNEHDRPVARLYDKDDEGNGDDGDDIDNAAARGSTATAAAVDLHGDARGGEPSPELDPRLARKHFKAMMSLRAHTLTTWRLLWTFVCFPVQTFLVVALIYYQAAVLFVRKHARFYSHPA